MSIDRVEEHRCFGGTLAYVEHDAPSTRCRMRFSVFTPPQAAHGLVPVLTFLSGLTCTAENFTVKAGAFRAAADLGLIVVAPDTSPRGPGVPDDGASDLGQGAGFYVDATADPWADHFRMFSYVTRDLPDAVFALVPGDPARQGIAGHSMGGLGALAIGLRLPGTYRSISAFAPIVAPSVVPWGRKAFGAYLGSDEGGWRDYDPCALVAKMPVVAGAPPILIDQGTADPFIDVQLRPELFEAACAQAGRKLVLRRQAGYDHAYFFIATFIEDHLRHHRAVLA